MNKLTHYGSMMAHYSKYSNANQEIIHSINMLQVLVTRYDHIYNFLLRSPCWNLDFWFPVLWKQNHDRSPLDHDGRVWSLRIYVDICKIFLIFFQEQQSRFNYKLAVQTFHEYIPRWTIRTHPLSPHHAYGSIAKPNLLYPWALPYLFLGKQAVEVGPTV